MTGAEALQEIDAALKQEGFKRDWGASGHPFYNGRLDRKGLNIPVSIEIVDLDFVDFPRIRLKSDPGSGAPIPHLMGADGEICYLARNSTVLDKYDPAGTVLRCLVQAQKAISDGLKGKLDADFAAEFANYWSKIPVFVDLPSDFSGPAEISAIAIRPKSTQLILATKGKLAASFMDTHRLNDKHGADPVTIECHVIKADALLGSDWDGRLLPTTLKQLSRFFRDYGAEAIIDQILREGTGLNRWIAVQGQNACCLACIAIPERFDKPEFMKSRKRNLPETLASVDVPVARYRGLPVDAKFLYERNLGDLPSLSGKKIALIGCGTIGSFLSLQLAQSGAGSRGGSLQLIDREILTPPNLGRHLLGLGSLYLAKAKGCADHITRQLPHLDVKHRTVNVLEILPSLANFDIVIDATGEEALSIAINDYAVNNRPAFPPVLHVWLVGNGSAAQTILCDGEVYACYKCQKPVLAKEPRHRVLRSDVPIDLRQAAACGDGLYVPFPVSRSVSAAALALEAVLAWNQGKPGSRFRTRIYDPSQVFQVKDTTLAPSDSCPACGPRRK